MARVQLSIILPCYNEGPTFQSSVNKIISTLENLKKDWGIIFVEDKSSDKTRESVKNIVAKTKKTRAIYHQRNQGRGKCLSDGIKAARGEICGFLDVDLEVSSDYIPIFVEEIEKGADMAVGRRFYEGGINSFPRFLASKIYALVVKTLISVPIDDTEAGYKFFRRSKILPILLATRDKKWFWDTEICARACFAGLKVSQIPVIFVRRSDKKSTVRLLPDTISYILALWKFRSQIATIKS